MARRKRRGERYIDKWLKEHPRVTFYMSRGEYEEVKRIADSRGLSLKELALEALKNVAKFREDLKKRYGDGYRDGYDKGYRRGFRRALRMFIDDPHAFYNVVKRVDPYLEPMLIVHQCSVCGEPIVFTHRDGGGVIEAIKDTIGGKDFRCEKCRYAFAWYVDLMKKRRERESSEVGA
jgi:hypothetical protein